MCHCDWSERPANDKLFVPLGPTSRPTGADHCHIPADPDVIMNEANLVGRHADKHEEEEQVVEVEHEAEEEEGWNERTGKKMRKTRKENDEAGRTMRTVASYFTMHIIIVAQSHIEKTLHQSTNKRYW